MADGTPVILRIGGTEDEILALLSDTDKRLSELERATNNIARVNSVLGVWSVDDLPPDPPLTLQAWVIDEQQVYSVQAGGRSGDENLWSAGGSVPGWS